MKRFITMAVIILFVTPLYAFNFEYPKGDKEDKLKIKNYIESIYPEMKNAISYKKALLLRDFIYHIVPVGKSEDVFSTKYDYLIKVITGKVPYLCGGISISYLSLLELYDIKARYIQLLSKDCKTNTSCETHVAIEIFLDNKWVIEDPTFNVEWIYNGQLLSFQELKELFEGGYTPENRSNGFNLIPKRTVEEYYIPYKILLDKQIPYYLNLWMNDE